MEFNDLSDIIKEMDPKVSDLLARAEIDKGYKDEMVRNSEQLREMLRDFSVDMQKRYEDFKRKLQDKADNTSKRINSIFEYYEKKS